MTVSALWDIAWAAGWSSRWRRPRPSSAPSAITAWGWKMSCHPSRIRPHRRCCISRNWIVMSRPTCARSFWMTRRHARTGKPMSTRVAITLSRVPVVHTGLKTRPSLPKAARWRSCSAFFPETVEYQPGKGGGYRPHKKREIHDYVQTFALGKYHSGSGKGAQPFHVLRHGLQGKRSEEHTSELQSRGHLVCRLLLEKKKKYDST